MESTTADLTGILLVGGRSRRFGSPKALALFDGETLAERAWKLLGESCERRIAVGKTTDALPLPFEIVDDGTDVHASMAGLVAGLRAASTELCVVIPVDCPALTPVGVHALTAGSDGVDAVVPQTGPLPGVYRRTVLPTLERRLAAGNFRLRDALSELRITEIELPVEQLVNVNTPHDLPGAPKPSPYETARVEVIRIPGVAEEDFVAVEEPLEIRIGDLPVAITMRTPGHDDELAIGFALGEGLDPITARVPTDLAANTVELWVRAFDPDRLRRHFYTSSSCGVCGKGALAAVAVTATPVESALRLRADLLTSLPDKLRAAQPTFALTGGLHAAGLFTSEGEPVCVREDVGRHNALDKVTGWAFQNGLIPLTDFVLCVSGRLSFELVQKAAGGGVPVLVGVGAPSSLAVELAQAQQITLCGFARRGRLNVYTHADRLVR